MVHPPETSGGPQLMNSRFLSKFGFTTTTSGRVRARVFSMKHTPPATDPSLQQPKTGPGARKPLVDKLMKMYTFGEGPAGKLDISKLHNGGSSAQRAAELIQRLQQEREQQRQNFD